VHAGNVWEKAGFVEEESREKAQAAKELYEDGLREMDYGIYGRSAEGSGIIRRWSRSMPGNSIFHRYIGVDYSGAETPT